MVQFIFVALMAFVLTPCTTSLAIWLLSGEPGVNPCCLVFMRQLLHSAAAVQLGLCAGCSFCFVFTTHFAARWLCTIVMPFASVCRAMAHVLCEP